MYFLDTVKTKIVKEVNRALKKKAVISVNDLVYPPSSLSTSTGTVADISLPMFSLAKTLGRNPAELAKEVAEKIGGNVCSVSFVGPYLNFTLNKKVFASQVLGEISKKAKKYGENKNGSKKKILVEYANQNTHKEVHVGHVRNFSYGDGVCRLLKANGFEALPFSYINDFGINTARVVWGLDNLYKDKKIVGDKGEFLGKLYSEATKKMEEISGGKEGVSEYMKAIETRSGDIYSKWQETRQWSIDSFAKIYRELGVKFIDVWYESQFIDEGFRLVEELKNRKILILSQGAIIADLEKFDLGVQVYLRADGTALYPVADLALAQAKVKKFEIDESIIVVDIRQALHFKQLFKVMELLGYKQKMTHLGYDFVTLPEGAMSSRSGNVVTYTQLKKALLKTAIASTREKHSDWSQLQIKKVAKKIAFGAMKFEMIKVSREKTITFDIEKSLRFDGFTSAYLQYTGARINSILKKSVKSEQQKVTGEYLKETKEHELVLKLAKYPEIVVKAGTDYEPSEIAKYLFELAQMFNDYYHAVPVLKAENEVMLERLGLLASIKQVLTNGLTLLGIGFIDEM